MKTIKVSDENHARLIELGRMFQTMDDVITTLLNAYANRSKRRSS
jgi:hypothetical protein